MKSRKSFRKRKDRFSCRVGSRREYSSIVTIRPPEPDVSPTPSFVSLIPAICSLAQNHRRDPVTVPAACRRQFLEDRRYFFFLPLAFFAFFAVFFAFFAFLAMLPSVK